MKNIKELKNAKAKDFAYVGQRLKEIRNDLINNDDTTTDKRHSAFSRKNVAERLGTDYYTITNVEKGSLTVTAFKLILYYYSLGYNPMWIIIFDNEYISKKNLGENLVFQDDIQKNFKHLEAAISSAISDFKEKI